MLNTSELSRITKEVMLGLEPTLTTPEALAMRRKTAENLAQMKRDGIMPDLPFDFDDLPALPPTPPDTRTEEEIRESKQNLIRANLGSSWAFAQQLEQEEREENERHAQCCQELLDRIEAQPESQRDGFLAEIAALTEEGRISPYHARRLRWAVQGNKPKRKRKRKR